MREWNVIATSLEGRRPALLAALRRLGAFWPAPFRNVVLGFVEDRGAFADRLKELLEKDRRLGTSLSRALAVEKSLTLRPDDLVQRLQEAVAPLAERIDGRRFYVRFERRGLKGKINSPAVEREIGEFLIEQLQRRGFSPKVGFSDPDVIVLIETVGETAGIALVEREARAKYAFIRVK